MYLRLFRQPDLPFPGRIFWLILVLVGILWTPSLQAQLAICGDTDPNQTIEMADARLIINYLYSSGTPLLYGETGDVNCDNKVSILDITYLIRYLYHGGPCPCAACRTVIVYGDSRTNHDMHRQIVGLMEAVKPSAVFHTGDLVQYGSDPSQWVIFNDITADLRDSAEFFPSLGNHEQQSPLYFDNFTLPGNEQWYSVERQGIHFIILNTSTDITVGSEQYRWLQEDLAGIADSVKYIIPVFHYPPYSTGAHDEDEKGLRTTLVPLFEQYGVAAVFNGHDHDYERSFCNGITYVVAGGGGAPLRDQSRTHPCSQLFLSRYHFCTLRILADRILVRVFDNNASQIDTFEITPRL